MIFARRGNPGPDAFLQRKVQLFFLGAILALVGIALDSSLLVGAAILILVAGVALRLLAGRGRAGEARPSEEEETDARQGKGAG